MGRGTKLYNLILPLWLLWIFPQTWLVVLPANFIVDLLVSALALRFAGARGIAGVLKFSILRTWLCGFAADAAGTALMAAPLFAEPLLPEAARRRWSDMLSYPLTMNPFESPAALLWTLGCVALSAFVIYRLNYNAAGRPTPPRLARARAFHRAVAFPAAGEVALLILRPFVRTPFLCKNKADFIFA